jgi:hypothetical protein
MNVAELFKKLSYGELSNLSLSVDGTGTIAEEHQEKVIIHANEGLLRLYSRFVLSEKDVIVEMVEGITNYHLTKRFAETNWNPEETSYPYIKDLGREPFLEDVIRILEVYDSLNCKLPLNDSERCDSLFTPQAKVLQVPHVKPGVALSVLYQAKHPPLSHENLEDEVDLPDVLHGALTAFIASKIFGNMNTQETTAKSQEFYIYYENICADAEEHDLVSTSISTTNTRFQRRGWV